MSTAAGRTYTAIPGPSVMPDRVLAAMMRPAPDIYDPALRGLVDGIAADLKRVARTRHHCAIFIGNGHAGWEAAIANTLSRGDKVLLLANGRFGHGWAETARRLGVDVTIVDHGKASPFDPSRAAQALADDAAHEFKAVICVHVDTSSSARSDIAALRKVMDDQGHPALLMVDCIASLGCDAFEMDAWGVDVTLAASQKGLMTPPGLCFLWYSDKALAATGNAGLNTPYWDWRPRGTPAEFYQFFCGTAPTHHLFALREALTMLLDEEGLEAAWARHAALARSVWAAFDAWGASGPLVMNIADPKHRTHALTAAGLGAPNATRLRDWLKVEAGVTLGIGLGMADSNDPAWHGYFRIAHMGHVNAHMTLGALAAMDAGLKALDIPHGDGALGAATAALASG